MRNPQRIGKLMRIVEYAWLFMLAVCLYEIIRHLSMSSYLIALMYAGLGVLAIFMFSFRRRQRRKFENHNRENE